MNPYQRPQNKLVMNIDPSDFWVHSSHNYFTTPHALLNMTGAGRAHKNQQRIFSPRRKSFLSLKDKFSPPSPFELCTRFLTQGLYIPVISIGKPSCKHDLVCACTKGFDYIWNEFVYFVNTANRNYCHK